ncbi:MAG TPA: AlkA N-terminal domain-containing protein [Acidimicrobiales bacterium]|nr:AlkA N-terminal domain-containing protein [Acidimicrobiales bacterium]
MLEDFERCYRAVQSRDARFDGWFFTAVTSTGIYCRPSCPALTPKRANVRFYPTAAAAQQAGFRACMRCRPDAAPGSPEWNARADVAGRAMRLIADGAVDRDGVAGLAARLGYGERQLHRVLVAEVGTGALALARAQRAQTARVLIETTDLPAAHVAFAAGFSSVRQFNDTVREVFASTPTELRRKQRQRDRRGGTGPAGGRSAGRGGGTGSGGGTGGGTGSGTGVVSLRLAYRQPFDAGTTFGFLAARAVAGVEAVVDGTFHRSLRLPHGAGTVALAPADGYVAAALRLDDLRDLTAAVSRCRRLLDLDADPVAVDHLLGRDPLLHRLVAATPGRRVPGTVDGAELAFRAVVGQQVSVAGARTATGRLVAAAGCRLAAAGCRLAAADGPVTHLFPSPDDLLALPDAALPMPAPRRRAIRALATAVADGDLVLDPGADPAELVGRLRAVPGIGDWTAGYVAMRALGDPDAFVATDLGVRRALRRLGGPRSAADVARLADRWRPWRAYATVHLWSVPDLTLPARPKEDAA